MTTGLRRVKVPLTLAESYVRLGWWMVMSDDEQGYAPAAFLESLNDGSQDKDEQLHTDADEGEII